MNEIFFEVHRISFGWICFSQYGTVFAISQPIMMAALIKLAQENQKAAKVEFNLTPPPDEEFPGGPELSAV